MTPIWHRFRIATLSLVVASGLLGACLKPDVQERRRPPDTGPPAVVDEFEPGDELAPVDD